MTDFHKVIKRIDSYRDEMIDLQVSLCSLPAISPLSGGEGEAKKAEFLLDFLNKIGLVDIEVIKAPDLDAPAGYRPNILAFYRGQSSSKTIWVMTHMDIVPPGELAQWRGDPFRAWVEEGKIYGRGTEDNQQDMVASLFALKAFHQEGILPRYDVGIALVADEETGSGKGIDYVLRHSNPFRLQDLIIVPDAGNSEGTMIEVAEKSILWLKFTTLGLQEKTRFLILPSLLLNQPKKKPMCLILTLFLEKTSSIWTAVSCLNTQSSRLRRKSKI